MLTKSLIDSMVIASSGMHPPLMFRVDTMIFSLLIFLGLAAVLLKYAWKPVMEGLDAREKRISDDMENAKLANEEAQSQLAAYQQKISGADDEAAALIAEAKNDAIAAKDKIMSEAANEAQRTRDRALADIETAKNAAVRELAESSVDSAVDLAGSIVGRSLNKGDHADLIEKSISQFTGS